MAALLLGRVGLLVLALSVGVLATGELLRLSRAGDVRPSAVAALGGTAALVLVAHARGESGPRVFPGIVAAVVGVAFVEMLARRDRAQLTRSLAFTIVPVLLVGVLGSYLVALREMRDGFRIALVLVLMVAAGEAFPAFARELRGEAGLTAPIRFGSAAAGALAIAIVAATAAGDTFAWGTAILLAALVTVAAPVGRMAAEMIEVDLLRLEPGAKRAGASLLRRIDGLLLAAPAFFYAFRVLAR